MAEFGAPIWRSPWRSCVEAVPACTSIHKSEEAVYGPPKYSWKGWQGEATSTRLILIAPLIVLCSCSPNKRGRPDYKKLWRDCYSPSELFTGNSKWILIMMCLTTIQYWCPTCHSQDGSLRKSLISLAMARRKIIIRCVTGWKGPLRGEIVHFCWKEKLYCWNT